MARLSPALAVSAQGCWQLHGHGTRRTGQGSITVHAALTTLPWFTRCGTSPLG